MFDYVLHLKCQQPKSLRHKAFHIDVQSSSSTPVWEEYDCVAGPQPRPKTNKLSGGRGDSNPPRHGPACFDGFAHASTAGSAITFAAFLHEIASIR